jgi:hypothetical protein
MVHRAEQDYNRLGFVPTAAEQAAGLYSRAKDSAPPVLVERLQQVESISAPYIAKAQDVGTTLLKSADAKVDQALNKAGQVYEENSSYLQSQLDKQKVVHKENLEAYRAARDAYLKRVEEAVEFLKAHGISGSARAAADEVLQRVGRARELPGYLLQRVEDAWERLRTLPPVAKIADTSVATYTAVHDRVVALPAYKQAYDLSQDVLYKGQQTWVWARAAPYVQPALNTVTATKYYQQAVQQLQPSA